MKTTMITSKWFKEEEFKACAPACSLQDMSQEFMNLLDRVRDEVGFPLKVNSAYRSKAHDQKKGRSGTGAHTQNPCKAVDLACTDSAKRFKLIEALLKHGIVRIGIAGTFIHVDSSPSHSQKVIWMY